MDSIFFREGSETKLNREEGGRSFLEVNVESVGNAFELQKLLEDNFNKFSDDLEIDRDSFRSLKFKFGDMERDLAMESVYLSGTFVSFSMKNPDGRAKDLKKWTLIGGEWDEKTKNIMDGVRFAKRLQNTPPNFMMPENFAEETRKFLDGLDGVEIEEIQGGRLEEERLGLIGAVGRASMHPPRLLIIKYSGAEKGGDPIALVGKGVCYDSGGLNIKTGSYMSSMKFDMSGGAVSVGAIGALAKNRAKINLIVAVPLVENAVSSNSYRPDDVVMCRNGMSIEIDNTDAEGRLVLADALAYVVDTFKPKEVITIATLTGAIGYALGSKYGGAWATSDQQWNDLLDSSIKAAEWVWRMPMDEYYLKALKKTRVADIKNSAKTGAGGSNRAAMFLKEFTGGLPYVHLDIANIDHCESTGEPTAPLLKTLYFYLFK